MIYIRPTYGIYVDSEKKLQTNHETYLSVIKQSLIISFFNLPFLKCTYKFNELFLPPDISLNFKTKLKSQKRDPFLEIAYK